VTKIMSLKIVGSILGGYKGRIIDDLYMTNAEAAVAGQGYFLSSGRWTKAATTAAVEAVCVKSAAAGADVQAVMEVVKPGDIIEADYTGTPNAAFLPGLKLAVLDANGANVDSATVTGGHLRLLAVDTANKKVQMLSAKNICQGA
jgi:hypothetical protein